MKKIFCILLFFSTIVFAHTMWVRIYYSNDFERQILLDRDYDILTGNAQEGYFEYFLDKEVVDELMHLGFRTDILHPDIITYLEATYGHLRIDFGYYYTYAEMVQELDQIAITYPDITHKVSIGQTWEGREIWAMKVSDNANQNEDEPTVLVTGVHHAREPIGTSICIDFINWLVTNYGTNDSATTIVNTDEVWLVPCVNPDGYVFNETYEDPWGGWRKNCRDNNNNGQMDPDYDGVDLNRNYAYQWGYDNNGSSPDPSSDTYRGPSPMSEPEVQAVGELCDSFEFLYAINYHSYGNYLIVPWGYINSWVPSPDSEIYHVMAESMTTYIGVPNNYTWGTAYQTVGYPANGTSDDWLYGEQGLKPKGFGFSPEVGTSFWQGANDTSIIVTHCNENRPMIIFLCLRAASTGVAETDRALPLSNISILPNPVTDRCMVSFNVDHPSEINIKIYDATGRLVLQTGKVQYNAGHNIINMDVRNLCSGVYLVNLNKGEKETIHEKLVILRK